MCDNVAMQFQMFGMALTNTDSWTSSEHPLRDFVYDV